MDDLSELHDIISNEIMETNSALQMLKDMNDDDDVVDVRDAELHAETILTRQEMKEFSNRAHERSSNDILTLSGRGLNQAKLEKVLKNDEDRIRMRSSMSPAKRKHRTLKKLKLKTVNTDKHGNVLGCVKFGNGKNNLKVIQEMSKTKEENLRLKDENRRLKIRLEKFGGKKAIETFLLSIRNKDETADLIEKMHTITNLKIGLLKKKFSTAEVELFCEMTDSREHFEKISEVMEKVKTLRKRKTLNNFQFGAFTMGTPCGDNDEDNDDAYYSDDTDSSASKSRKNSMVAPDRRNSVDENKNSSGDFFGDQDNSSISSPVPFSHRRRKFSRHNTQFSILDPMKSPTNTPLRVKRGFSFGTTTTTTMTGAPQINKRSERNAYRKITCSRDFVLTTRKSVRKKEVNCSSTKIKPRKKREDRYMSCLAPPLKVHNIMKKIRSKSIQQPAKKENRLVPSGLDPRRNSNLFTKRRQLWKNHEGRKSSGITNVDFRNHKSRKRSVKKSKK